MPYFVYILKSDADASYYIGSTGDLNERLLRHNEGRSAYTKGMGPWNLVYSEEFPDRSSAMRREAEIKGKKRRSFVESLVRTSR